jgi:hypothetical protein
MTRSRSHDPCVASLWVPALACILAALAPADASADTPAEPDHACSATETWDSSMSMCMPSASAASARTLVSAQFNVFGVFSVLQGPRGVDQFAAPNMLMLDVGRLLTPRHFFNLDLMGTTELWTYPRRGYPELLQIGEEHSNGQPFVDAQHPHSSPIMGLTLSDTIRLGSSKTLKLFFAPRGESTDGPIAFVHRDSARDDPDAPLGHHVGQDVGHVTSTVLGAQLNLGQFILEASAFNGTEPNPTVVDLPLGPINSEALRLTYVISSDHQIMASVANVEQSDPQYPGTSSATRLSTSLYDRFALGDFGLLDQTFVVGSITRHPTDSSLTSFLDEAVLQRGSSDVWGRVEVLQRLASELEIPTWPLPASDVKHWISAVTVGYTHWWPAYGNLQLGLGTSLTMDVVPGAWASAYGSHTPLTARFIFQLRGSRRLAAPASGHGPGPGPAQ